MISRLETMVLMGMELPLPAVRSQIASGIDILVHLGRLRDRSRRVLNIAEVVGICEGEIKLSELFSFVEKPSENKMVCGQLERVGELQNTAKCKSTGYQLAKENRNEL